VKEHGVATGFLVLESDFLPSRRDQDAWGQGQKKRRWDGDALSGYV
tara:strand:+ start:1561 stop:1698 length:138 start_codon:yes stop_codon:yes gene_type:complete